MNITYLHIIAVEFWILTTLDTQMYNSGLSANNQTLFVIIQKY